MKKAFFLIIILPLLTGCKGCSKVRHHNYGIENSNRTVRNERNSSNSNNSYNSSVIKMKQESGVYFVPIKINGVDMEFVFDTGASSISISETEAMFLLKQGKLKENDIKENIQFTDANGDISDGTRINLREVQIGDVTVYDVEASVVHNQQAPLLFGQSAMNRFGKITIDYNNNTITFN
jgi:aspartyl protease family protein